MHAPMQRYRHTQRGWLHLLLWSLGGAFVVLAFRSPDPMVALALGIGACLLVLGGFCFATLSVRDEGARLSVRFGPLPLVGKEIRFEDIRGVRRARSRWIDGQGMHWLPRRGWTLNVAGFECVELELAGGQRVRIGTDDPEGLASYLERRVPAA